MLIATGALDPVYSRSEQARIAGTLPKAQFVLFPRGGVMPIGDNFAGCGSQIMLAFLAAPEAPVDAACARAAQAEPFLTAYHRTSAPGQLLVAASLGHYPIGAGMLLAAVLAGAIAMPAWWLVRALRRRSAPGTAVVPRAQLLAWLAALLAIAGCAGFAAIVWDWAGTHSRALPAGVPNSVMAAVGVAVIAAVMALVAIGALWRWRDARPAGPGSVLAAGLALVVIGTAIWLAALL